MPRLVPDGQGFGKIGAVLPICASSSFPAGTGGGRRLNRRWPHTDFPEKVLSLPVSYVVPNDTTLASSVAGVLFADRIRRQRTSGSFCIRQHRRRIRQAGKRRRRPSSAIRRNRYPGRAPFAPAPLRPEFPVCDCLCSSRNVRYRRLASFRGLSHGPHLQASSFQGFLPLLYLCVGAYAHLAGPFVHVRPCCPVSGGG